jgi:hypothetical protein
VKDRLSTILALLAVAAGWIVYTSWQGPLALKRSLPGRVMRYITGSPGFVQDVDDLADELSLPTNAAALRLWAASVLEAQGARQFPAESVQFRGLLAVVETPEIPPPPILATHRALFGKVSPQTCLHVDASGQVTAVVLSWAHLRIGLVVLPGNHAPPVNGNCYQRQPAADICIFSTYS